MKPRNVILGAGGLVLGAVALVGGLWVSAVAGQEEGGAGATTRPAVRYGRDIRPILSDRCFKCHGPDPKSRAANLRLDLRESAIAKRGPRAPIVPGDPDASQLVRRVSSKDPGMIMPPPESNKRPFSAEEQALLRRWIAEGAVYEPHWAFVPPKRPAPPEVRTPAWCRNPIDRFILAQLEQSSVTPSPEADRETLIRRVFLDVTGLPPTPEAMDAFLADQRPDAYERWVDKLLGEEPYRTRAAEHFAVPWLDAARYADTCGIHMDAGRQMWLWRDWVLKAFRENMPFDRFVTEQIAGDLLPNATAEQKTASGFNRNHVTSDEGGAIAAEYLVEYAVDRASTTGSVFLGLTVGCARCHEHKFDPISQEEFYRFYSFFNSIEEPGLYSQLPDPQRAFEPFLVVPTPEQAVQLAELRKQVADLTERVNGPRFEDDARRENFTLEMQKKAGLAWQRTRAVAAASSGGATLTIQPDDSVLVSGKNPDKDTHTLTVRTEADGLRLLMLEGLPDPSLPLGRVGRVAHGNAVLNGVTVEARSVADPKQKTPVRFTWAWANYQQEDGDFQAANVLDGRDDRGWAVGGHQREGGRVLLLLAEKPFGFEGGTELQMRLKYSSIYPQHILGRVRLTAARLDDAALDLLPAAVSGWYQVGPFRTESAQKAYATAFGPESASIDTERKFAEQSWRIAPNLRDAEVNGLPDGVGVTYVGKRVFCPSPRRVEVSLGSDDGFALFLNGKQVAAQEVDRAPAPDQNKATLELPAGVSTLVFKIVNTGGPAGFYYRALARADELVGDLVIALVPSSIRSLDMQSRLSLAWKSAYSPGYREDRERLMAAQKRIEEIEARQPRTMVMQELPTTRPTYLLVRGQYDHPDMKRPVTRGVPAALGALPKNAPLNRLGLAQWLTSPDNPLVARVAVNRQWEMLFGTGIVRTSEDFGQQGEWPSHPELLDWLAVEFREHGWDVRHMLRLMLTSTTYRQSSRVRPELRERDPDNRLLAYFPRRRLGAETIRDQALYMSGLLVEKLGGPSVKPYQPEGIWQEVAMIQSNTRLYQRGEGADLWRRSLYTYWKRACPPPALMTFDAPTREACVIRRPNTDTPLQALVLWNDEQFVEAARLLATRTLRESADDRGRIVRMFRRCVGRAPGPDELQPISETLAAFRERYQKAPAEAAKLIKVGDTPPPGDIAAPELAAWTMIANALMSLSATITQG